MSEREVSGLFDHLGYWHHRFGRLVHTHFERRLAEHGITVSQWCVLVLLYHRQAETISEVAAAFPIDQAAASRLVARLESKDLLVRTADPADRRSTRLALTPEGRRLTPELAAAADANDQAYFGALSRKEVAQYKALLAKLLKNLGEEPAREWVEAPLKKNP